MVEKKITIYENLLVANEENRNFELLKLYEI